MNGVLNPKADNIIENFNALSSKEKQGFFQSILDKWNPNQLHDCHENILELLKLAIKMRDLLDSRSIIKIFEIISSVSFIITSFMDNSQILKLFYLLHDILERFGQKVSIGTHIAKLLGLRNNSNQLYLFQCLKIARWCKDEVYIVNEISDNLDKDIIESIIRIHTIDAPSTIHKLIPKFLTSNFELTNTIWALSECEECQDNFLICFPEFE
ncbi:MAG: hypothetical protein MHPSP_000962, partial [Paramarteilia canceri]